MNIESLRPSEEKQLAYDYIEDGPDKRANKFYDWMWTHYHDQMRVMILAYVAGDGAKEFNEYLQEQEEC